MSPDDPQDFVKKYAPWFDKKTYQPIFSIPPEPWIVEAEWTEGYFRAARRIVEDIVSGKLFATEIWGPVALYLFRHYLELALKYIVLHARFLKDTNTNAEDETIQ